MSQTNENNTYGIDFINRIDKLLNDKGITRKDFASTINIPQTTMSSWKTNNSVPPIDTVVRIADTLKVSPAWLLFGSPMYSPDSEIHSKASRTQIRNKIYSTIATKLQIENADNEKTHNFFFENIPELNYETLLNWSKGLVNLDLHVFEDIAYSLGISLDYLFSDKEPSKANLENASIDKKIYEAALRNLNDLLCLDNLTGKRHELAKDMLNQLMQLEHLEYVEKNKSKKND